MRYHRSVSSRARAGAYLLHPAVVIAIAVLVVNDHWLKHAIPSWLTGKLSDAAGMVFFPLIAAGLVDLGSLLFRRELSESARRTWVTAWVIATGVVFASIQLSELCGDIYRHGLGAIQWPVHALIAAARGHGLAPLAPVEHTPDPTDLVALPFLFIPWWIAHRRSPAS